MTQISLLRSAVLGCASACLAACGSITGLDGTSTYACKAPDGVRCDSMSGTYYNAVQNNLPAQRKSSQRTPNDAPAPATSDRRATALQSTSAPSQRPNDEQPASLRAAPRVMRVWIKPWEDTDHDLNGESMVYVQVDDGRWLVDHVQRQTRAPFAPIRAAKLTSANTAKSNSNETPRPPGALASGSEDEATVSQGLKAMQPRGGITPLSDN